MLFAVTLGNVKRFVFRVSGWVVLNVIVLPLNRDGGCVCMYATLCAN